VFFAVIAIKEIHADRISWISGMNNQNLDGEDFMSKTSKLLFPGEARIQNTGDRIQKSGRRWTQISRINMIYTLPQKEQDRQNPLPQSAKISA